MHGHAEHAYKEGKRYAHTYTNQQAAMSAEEASDPIVRHTHTCGKVCSKVRGNVCHCKGGIGPHQTAHTHLLSRIETLHGPHTPSRTTHASRHPRMHAYAHIDTCTCVCVAFLHPFRI